MGATLFAEINYSLSKLIEDIAFGEIGLPDIQRPFIWPKTKVRDLFDSMYKGFPVGYLLFWANGAGGGHRQIGSNVKPKVPNRLIVDGQQRLTSLYAVIKGVPVVREDYQAERILIAFNPITEEFAVTDAAIRKDPAFIVDISELWSKGIFKVCNSYLKTLQASRVVSDDEEDAIQTAINNLDNINHYPFTALEISSSADEEQVAEIFVRVNSKGTPLNQANFILTLMSVFWDEGRADLERFCYSAKTPSVSSASPFSYLIQPDPDQLLRVAIGFGFRRARLNYAYLLLRGKDLATGQFSDSRRDEQFEVLRSAQEQILDVQNWQDFLWAIKRAGFLSNQIISSQNALLYSYVFYLMGKCDYGVDHHRLRRVIARWFFMSSLTSRYSGSFESTMEQDLGRLRDVNDADGFVEVLERVIDDTLTDDFWSITLPNELGTSSSRSPALLSYYAALVLLKAPVLFSDLAVSDLLDPSVKAKKSAIERHHLFPRGYLSKLGITDIHDVNQIANFALVEWEDNIEISDASPAKYFPRYEKNYTAEDWESLRRWHALPVGWHEMPYQDFLAQRRKGIAQAIREGYGRL